MNIKTETKDVLKRIQERQGEIVKNFAKKVKNKKNISGKDMSKLLDESFSQIEGLAFQEESIKKHGLKVISTPYCLAIEVLYFKKLFKRTFLAFSVLLMSVTLAVGVALIYVPQYFNLQTQDEVNKTLTMSNKDFKNYR